MGLKLIVTADDYGMCGAVNEAIDECLGAGVVRATCVMTNMPAVAAASSLRNRFPQRSIGIHWNLTQGQPILPASEVPSLVSHDGRFHSSSELRRRWLSRRLNLEEVRAELTAQYQRFYELAGTPDFWNTHEDAHVWPGLFETCVALGQELHIIAMRSHRRFTIPRGSTTARYNLFHPLYWLKGQIIALWSYRAESWGISMPDGKIHMPGYGTEQADIASAVKRLQGSGVKQAVELVIHPATAVHEDLFGGLTAKRLLEYKTFRDPGFVKLLRQEGIETAGFEAVRP